MATGLMRIALIQFLLNALNKAIRTDTHIRMNRKGRDKQQAPQRYLLHTHNQHVSQTRYPDPKSEWEERELDPRVTTTVWKETKQTRVQ